MEDVGEPRECIVALPPSMRALHRSWRAAARPVGRTCRGNAPLRGPGPRRRSRSLRDSRPETPDTDSARRPRIPSASVSAAPSLGLSGFSRSSLRKTAKRSNRHGSAASSPRVSQSTPRNPIRGGQRMISPRSGVRITVWVKWVDRDIFREKSVEHRAEQEYTRAFERSVFHDHRDLEASGGRRALGLPQAASNRSRDDRANAADLPVGRAVREVREQDQSFPQRLGVLVRRMGNQPEMVETEHADQTPRDVARGRVGALAGHRGQHRFPRARGRGNAAQFEVGGVEKPKVGPGFADRELFGQMPVVCTTPRR